MIMQGKQTHSTHNYASALSQHILSEQARLLYQQLPGITLAPNFAGLLLVAMLWRHLPPAQTVSWLAITLFTTGLLGGSLYWWHRHSSESTIHPEKWIQRFLWVGFAIGASWGLGGILLFVENSLQYQLLVALILYSAAATVALTMAAHRQAFYVVAIPILTPIAVRFATLGENPYPLLAAITFTFLLSLSYFYTNVHRGLLDSIKLWYEKHELVRHLESQKELHEQADRAKSRLLATISHDLRQSIQAQSFFVAELKEQCKAATVQNTVEHLAASITSLEQLLNRVLNHSSLESGAITAEKKVFPIAPLLRQVVKTYEPETRNKGIELRVVYSKAHIYSDPVLLLQILQNLMANAIRYTHSGKILIGCRRNFDSLSIQVLDTGIGIAPEELTSIFEEFYRANPSGDSASPGFGLGLSIVKQLSDILGHSIDVHSVPQRGSLFAITVPLISRSKTQIPASGRAGMPDRDVTRSSPVC